VIELVKMCTYYRFLPCTYASLLRKNQKIFQRILWVYLSKIFTRHRSSTSASKRFKGLITCAKSNRDSDNSELGFRVFFFFFFFFFGTGKSFFWGFFWLFVLKN